MPDEKDGDRKGAYVNIQTNTDSKVNLETVFEKIMNYQNKSLEIVVEESSSHANSGKVRHELRVQIHKLWVEMHGYEFKFTSYEFKFTSYETKSTNCKTKSPSWEIKNMS